MHWRIVDIGNERIIRKSLDLSVVLETRACEEDFTRRALSPSRTDVSRLWTPETRFGRPKALPLAVTRAVRLNAALNEPYGARKWNAWHLSRSWF